MEAWVACKKKIETNFVYESTCKNGNAYLKTSIFSKTDSDDETNRLTSKLHSSISLLEKLKFSQADSNYKVNWSTSKLQSSNCFLEKFTFLANWSSLWFKLKYFILNKFHISNSLLPTIQNAEDSNQSKKNLN